MTDEPEAQYLRPEDAAVLPGVINSFLGVLEGMTDELSGSVWQAMTCIEVEAIAAIPRSVGIDWMADAIITLHAETDEEDDQHYVNDLDDDTE